MEEDPIFTVEEMQVQLGGVEGQDAPNGEGEGPPTNKKRTRETYAEVWNDYNKGPPNADGSYYAFCKYCGKKYKMGNQRSTTSMKNHLKTCYKYKQAKRQKIDPSQKCLQTSKEKGIETS